MQSQLDQVYIKQEPLAWLTEELTQTPETCPSVPAMNFQLAGYSSGEQLPIYTLVAPEMSCGGIAGPSSPPSVEIALPLEDEWTNFLMDN